MGVSSTLSPSKTEHTISRRTTVLWVIAALVPIVAVIVFAVLQPVKVRPRIGLAPGYAFTDQSGVQLSSEDVRGKLVFYNFMCTTCGEPAAQATATMAQIREVAGSLDTGGLPVEFVSISFDPTRDTPAILQQYAAQIDPSLNEAGSDWRFVSGPVERLKNVIGGGFSVFYQQDDAGSFTFDPTIVLVDGNGIMRAIYRRDLPDMQTIERDLMLVVSEVKNSEGPGKLVYEAAHLYLCYPPS